MVQVIRLLMVGWQELKIIDVFHRRIFAKQRVRAELILLLLLRLSLLFLPSLSLLVHFPLLPLHFLLLSLLFFLLLSLGLLFSLFDLLHLLLHLSFLPLLPLLRLLLLLLVLHILLLVVLLRLLLNLHPLDGFLGHCRCDAAGISLAASKVRHDDGVTSTSWTKQIMPQKSQT